LKTIITMTNNLTDIIFKDNFYLDPCDPFTSKLELQLLSAQRDLIQTQDFCNQLN